MHVSPNAPLAPLTTLRIGGAARTLVQVTGEPELEEALRDASERGDAVFVLGGGSNVVVADAGFDGTVLHIASRGWQFAGDAERVVVDAAAGEDWDALVARTVDAGLAGLECLSGIPGLVGATPIQNVGAYGQDVSETIVSVRAYDRDESRFVELTPSECEFAYRDSMLKRSDRYVVSRVRFALARGAEGVVRYAELARELGLREGDRAPLALIRETVVRLRGAKGMVLSESDPDSVSAGSFFTNPIVSSAELAHVEERVASAEILAAGETMPRFPASEGRHKLSAGWLVERAGFRRGYGAGRVGVSKKHALALVNRGGATSAELLALAREVRDGVHAVFGVKLVPEPVFVGFRLDETNHHTITTNPAIV